MSTLEGPRTETVARKVLIVDDDSDLTAALAQLLASEQFQVTTAATAEDALEKFRDETFHLVLTDLQLPGKNGIALIKAIHEAAPATRCVLITGHGSIRSAVLALKRGATEYVTKPIKPRRLLTLCMSLTSDLPAYLPNKLLTNDRADVARMHGMVARSKVMKLVFERIRQAAAADTPVLLIGENGAGKELVAAAIHAQSRRARGPFIAVETGALAPDLIPAELFGREGAPGRIASAEGGTFFIDEVSALDERTQLALLRILEGQSDVRIIAGTSRDPQAMVAGGQLKEHLYYRLGVFTISIPPLRERVEDIPVIAADLLAELAARYRKPVSNIPPQTERLLTSYSWPGNKRELRNVIEQGVLLARGDELDPSLLPQMLHREPTPTDILQIPIGTTMDAVEREVILRTLEANKGNKTVTAEVLGISRRSIYNKLAEYEAQGLLRPAAH